MTYSISDVFEYYGGNHGLTEEVIYNQQPFEFEEEIPIFSGSKNNEIPISYISKNAKNKDGEFISYFEGPCLILTKDGSAGNITYKSKKEGIFTINHHACVLKLKKDFIDMIDLEWFYFENKHIFLNFATSKSDNGVLNTKWFDKIKFNVPPKSLQITLKKNKKNIKKYRKELTKAKIKINKILENEKFVIYGEKYKIKEVFNISPGNHGLTEEFIYNNQPTNLEELLPVLSGATNKNNFLGYISENSFPKGKKLKIYEGPFILIRRVGYAGNMTYISAGKYVSNEHAYILTPKSKFKDKVNLTWFKYQYQELFLNLITSKSDNSVFNKKYAEQHLFMLPSIEKQNKFAKKIMKLHDIENDLNNMIIKLDRILEKYQI